MKRCVWSESGRGANGARPSASLCAGEHLCVYKQPVARGSLRVCADMVPS